MAFLLDTNVWIVYLKSPVSKIRDHLEQVKPSGIFVCSVVKAELIYGALKYGHPQRRSEVVRQLLDPYVSLPFDDRAAAAYGAIRHKLEIKGRAIGPHDLMIAAIAQVNALTLVTSNRSEFARIPDLKLEDWQS